MFQSGCSDFIADFLHYRQPKHMRRGFSGSLLNVRMSMLRVSARLCAIEILLIIMNCRSEAINKSAPYHSEGIELRVVNIVSVQLPITGK
jgi:hypothetical protein